MDVLTALEDVGSVVADVVVELVETVDDVMVMGSNGLVVVVVVVVLAASTSMESRKYHVFSTRLVTTRVCDTPAVSPDRLKNS